MFYSKIVGDYGSNFPQKLLLTDRQVENLRKAFVDKSPTHINPSETQLSKKVQSGGFLGRLLGPLLEIGLPLLKNIIKPLAKSVSILLGLTAAASAAGAGIHEKMLGCGGSSGPKTTTLIISNDEMKDIIEIVKCLEDSGLLFIIKYFLTYNFLTVAPL